MDEMTRRSRAEVSRRLKAARWLAGATNEKGQPAPLSPEALAEREPLQRNGITANAIAEIERLVKDARPMELREIALALGMPNDWFTVEKVAPIHPDTSEVEQALRRLQEQLAGLGATRHEPPAHTPDTSESTDTTAATPQAHARGNEGTA